MTAVRVPGVTVIIAGHGRVAMPPSLAFLSSRWAASDAVSRHDALWFALIAAFHLAALGLMAWSEGDIVPNAVFLLTWSLLNFFWLVLLRRPAVSAALSLMMIVVLILLSRLKYDMIWMTANFFDVWIVNADTISFLFSVRPDLSSKIVGAVALMLLALGLLWWIDSFRVRLRTAAIGFVACLVGLSGVSLAFPQHEWEGWFVASDTEARSSASRSGPGSRSTSGRGGSATTTYPSSRARAFPRSPD